MDTRIIMAIALLGSFYYYLYLNYQNKQLASWFCITLYFSISYYEMSLKPNFNLTTNFPKLKRFVVCAESNFSEEDKLYVLIFCFEKSVNGWKIVTLIKYLLFSIFDQKLKNFLLVIIFNWSSKHNGVF